MVFLLLLVDVKAKLYDGSHTTMSAHTNCLLARPAASLALKEAAKTAATSLVCPLNLIHDVCVCEVLLL